MPLQVFIATALLCCLCFASASRAVELPPGATVLDADIIWDLFPKHPSDSPRPQNFAISPDGKQIAYVSRGALWRCPIDAGPPIKLVDLPGTMTAYLAAPKYAAGRNTISNLAQVLPYGDFQTLWMNVIDVVSLAWTPDGDALIYALRKPFNSNTHIATHRVMRVSLAGDVEELAVIERGHDDHPSILHSFRLADGDSLLVCRTESGAPLIWGRKTSRPLVTPFDLLVPSSTSGRYLGIEIDTRQLVLVGEDLQIRKRFDVNFKSERQTDLTWSADERYAICRRKGKYSDMWIALRVDLETGTQRQFNGSHWTDRFEFTGRGGEFVQYGIIGVRYDHLDKMAGAYLTLVSEGDEPPRDLVRFDWRPQSSLQAKLAERPYYPAVLHDGQFETFMMPLPRASTDHPGFLYHMIDRQGRRWPLTADDESKYLAPATILAVVNNGQIAIARNETTLFTMPLPSHPQEADHD